MHACTLADVGGSQKGCKSVKIFIYSNRNLLTLHREMTSVHFDFVSPFS